MKKLFTLSFLLVAFLLGYSQQVLLYSLDFENPGDSTQLVFDSLGPATGTGNNVWTVNSLYTGQPIYPNTPNEDSVVSGTITNAPYSNYLHINNTADPGGVANANWDTSSASDRFCYLGSSFCTLGLDSVIFQFFWVCQGDTNAGAYGRLYFSADGGPWTQTGRAKYAGQSKWLLETVLDPRFNNVQNLQFGFRWTNPVTTDSSDVSWGIDDILAVGSYDSILQSGGEITISLYDTNAVCQGNPEYFYMQFTQPLCDGDYEIQMSNANGVFGANPVNLGVYALGPTVGLGLYSTLSVPNNALGNCYKLRVVRTNPPVEIISDTTVCFSIIHCPNIIDNLSSVVMTDVDTVCVLSELDVMFNSFGVFGNNNVYIAELSDTNGSFIDSFYLGQLKDSSAYPSIPQGDVSGLIPQNVPPGCGYYIRIISTNPYTISSTIGPFCIVDCDELTNNHTDIHFCIHSGPYGECDTIDIEPHYWGNQSNYDTCNVWTVQLRSMMDFSFQGNLETFHDSVGGPYVICVPSTADSLLAMGIAPGAYYMRIVSNCSNESWNENGTIIRCTIGAPDTMPPLLTFNDSGIYCNTSEIDVTVNPFNSPPSTYYWSSNLLNNGNTFSWMYNPLRVTLNPAVLLGIYVFYVQEDNFGCYGPSSAPGYATIIGTPPVAMTGPPKVCLDDTVKFYVNPYQKATYYTWSVPNSVEPIILGNNIATFAFDSLGTFTITNNSLNACGTASGTFKVNVVPPYAVYAGPNDTVCVGSSINLTVQSDSLHYAFIPQDTTPNTRFEHTGAMFNIVAHDEITIDSFAVRYSTAGQVHAQVYDRPGTYMGFTQSQTGWRLVGVDNNLTSGGANVAKTIQYEIRQHINAGDTFGFFVTTTNSVKQVGGPGTGIQQGVVYKSDGIIDYVQGIAEDTVFGPTAESPYILNCTIYYSSRGALNYKWSTGDTTQTINYTPAQSGWVTVRVYDTTNCANHDSLYVMVAPSPTVQAGADTIICPGINFTIPASATGYDSVAWSPVTGLTNTSSLNPVFNSSQGNLYIVTAANAQGCKKSDSININVRQVLVSAGPDTSLCMNEIYIIPGTSSTPNFTWYPATGLSDTGSLTPTFNYNESTVYVLTANDSGCIVSDSLAITVTICNTYIQVPGAFTPNGDGNNDHFTVFGQYISSYQIRIFNRWGEEVYESEDVSELNNLSKGWDGTYKGKKQETGTFVYYIAAKDINGKSIDKKGNLTLIR